MAYGRRGGGRGFGWRRFWGNSPTSYSSKEEREMLLEEEEILEQELKTIKSRLAKLKDQK
jgi:hypothetical protein